MSNEIKQGDKVRVSSRVPRIYERFGSMIAPHYECKVVEIDDGMALLDSIPVKHVFLFPLKYLVKVDAETKEPKFKVGDVVRIKPTADKLHQGYQNGYAWLPERDEYLGRVASVKEIWCDGSIILSIRNNMLWEPIDLEPYTEPTEQTEAEKKPNVGSIKIPVEVDLTDSYWVQYEADLAKEIVLKTVNSASDKRPSAIAEYAVSVAKAVVEGLKRK